MQQSQARGCSGDDAEATQPGHGELLVLESTGSTKAIGAGQIEPLPRQVCAAEARVHSRAFRASQGSCQGDEMLVPSRKQVSTTTRARANSPLAAARLRSGSGRETLGRASCCSRATATAKSNPSAGGSRSGPWPGAPACCSTELRKSRAGQNRLRRVPDWNDLDRVDAGHAAGHPDRPDRSDAGVSDDHRGARARLREAVTTRSRSRRLRVRAAELQRVGRHQYVLSSGCQRVIVTGE